MQRNVSIMRQSKHNKKVADAKAKSRSLINASLLWHFKNKSQIDDLQLQIKHQNNENKRIQLNSNFETSILRCFLSGKMKEINVIQEDLRNTVQVLQNELMEKDSEIQLIKKLQELQEVELKMDLRIKEAAVGFLQDSDLQFQWKMKEMNLRNE